MSESNGVLEQFSEIKATVNALELDANKSANGNAAASLRLRKGLRQLKGKIGDLVKHTLTLSKKSDSDSDAAE